MPAPPATSLNRLLEAAEILHAHGHGPFHRRLFKASRLIFGESLHTFELYDRAGAVQTGRTDAPLEAAPQRELIRRIGELVRVEHPVLPVLMRGERAPLRLKDFLTLGQFHRMALFDEFFRRFALKHQLVIPAHSATHAGGLSINRGGCRDFTREEAAAAVTFGRHLALAFDADRLLQGAAPAQRELEESDFLHLRRRGLTRRECEVLWWIAQGRRDAEIAVILGIARRTASHHAENIFARLGVETRTAAAAEALSLFGRR